MKGIIKIGWKEDVMELDEALELIQKLQEAERFEEYTEYKSKEKTYHVWSEGIESVRASVEVLTDSGYRAAKLLGKHEKST